MIRFHKRSERLRPKLEPELDDAFNAVMVNADRLADSVIANCDDWAEGRAFAYALRLSLDKYRQAKLHLNLKEAPK